MPFLGVTAVLWLACCGGPAMPYDDKKPNKFDDIDPSAAKVDVPSLIRVRTEQDVARVRKELIAFIWKNDGQLPTASEVVRADADLPKPFANYPATCETLTIAMDKDSNRSSTTSARRQPTKSLAIFHQGHDDVWTGGGGRRR